MHARVPFRLSALSLLSVLVLLVAACGQAAPAIPAAVPQETTLGTLEIHSFDLGFKPNQLTVDKPGLYTIRFVNDGTLTHDITLPTGAKEAANPGETKEFYVNVPAGGIAFFCSVPGHADAGMRGTIAVAGTVLASHPVDASMPGMPGMQSPDTQGGSASDIAADPNAPPYVLYDAAAPAPLEGTVHDVDLVVQEKLMTVATGYVQAVWTFNGTVPGPVIRVHLGDTVRIYLKNPATNQMPHSIDFHASQVAWNDAMTSINPGQEKLYEWHADYAGVWMYHCGTSPALDHMANGMYGMVIVEPQGGLPKVDKEFALVQSEWYLGPQGQPVSLAKASAAAPAPDFVVFNGVANQYQDHPLRVEAGQTVRFFLLDAGPDIGSSFHIVGTIFHTVIKEGMQLTADNPGHWGSQAVDLSPAQGAIVELTVPENGKYPIVTHAFNFVGRGALGFLQAGDGNPPSR